MDGAAIAIGESQKRTEKCATHGGGGRRGALRRDGGCGDGGMLLDIFSVEGEQGDLIPNSI